MGKSKEVIAGDAMHTLFDNTKKAGDEESMSSLLREMGDTPTATQELNQMAEALSATLTDAGWPDPFRAIVVGPDEVWRYLTPDDGPKTIAPGHAFQRGHFFTEHRAEPLSPDYYLARMAKLITVLRSSMDHNTTLSAAYWLGRLDEQMQSRGVHLRKVESWAVRDDARRRGKDAREAENARRKAEAEPWRVRAREIAASVTATGGARIEAIRKSLRREGIDRSETSIRNALKKR